MAQDFSKQPWHGIPRKEIPWFPTVIPEKCIGCELCFVTCPRGVYEITPDKYHKAVVNSPYNCMVGCSTCSTVCPTEAITFPERDIIWRVEREYKIFKLVHQEAKAKKEVMAAKKARAEAEEKLSKITSRAQIEVAGEFGEKRFLVQLEELVNDRPYDIVNLRLEVPTVKGAAEKAPSFMRFEVTSTDQEDIREFLEEVRTLVRMNKLVLVSEKML